MYHTIKTPAVVGPIETKRHAPMTEDQYAAALKAQAIKDGQRKRFPASDMKTGSIRRPDAYNAILQSIRDGFGGIVPIAKDTGFSRQFVQDRLRYLRENGKIEKVGNQWRIKE